MKINILKDEGLQEVCKPFISGMLPHENYKAEFFTDILQSLYLYIRLEEFSGPYYVLLKTLDDLNKLKSRFDDYKPSLTKDSLEKILQMSVEEFIMTPEVDMRYVLDHEGLNSDLNIETTKELACQKLYAMTLELYDECFSLKEDSECVLDQIPALRAAFIGHVSQESINTQALILQGSTRVGGKTLSGSEDWFQYLQRFSLDVNERLTEGENTITKLNNLEEAFALFSNLKQFGKVITNYGIPELDYKDGDLVATPILRHRLVVIIGHVNVGKSMFCIDNCVNVLMAGKRAVYMYGETALEKIFAQIVVCYVKKKYKVSIAVEHLAELEKCPENVQKVVTIALHDIMDLLYLKPTYNYFTIYDELQADYDKYKFDAVFIDHSYALDGLSVKDNGKASIDAMSLHLRNFKRKYPVYLCVASHPSTTARDSLSKNKDVKDSPTKGSSNLYAEADEVFLLKNSENAEKSGQIELHNMKRRDAPVLEDPIILTKNFSFYSFIYDERLQIKVTGADISAEDALAALSDEYSDSDSYELSGY